MTLKNTRLFQLFSLSSTGSKLIISTALLLTVDSFVGHGDLHLRSWASPGDRDISIAEKYPHASAFFFTAQSQQREYQCEGKIYCSQMTSCEEAKFYLKNCPDVKIDGDGDGIPCESQWCHR